MLRLLNEQRTVMPPLINYKNLKIDRALEYDYSTLSFDIPVKLLPEYLKLENYIQTQTEEYVIKSIEILGDTASVICDVNIDELEGSFFEKFETKSKTAKECAELALAGTGWLVECDLEKKRTIKVTNKYVWDIIKQIASAYRLELKIDSINKILTFVEHRGNDKGVYFSDSLNLKKINIKTDTEDFYTRLIPVGKNGLTIESVNDGKKYIENYQYSNKIKTYYWKDERYTIAENLKEDARAKLNDLSRPYIAYSCDVIDLANAGDKKYKILSYNIGDTVTLLDSLTNIRERQRIVKITEYPDEPEKNTCELANTVISFEEYAQKYEDTSSTVDNITTDDGTIDGDCIDNIPASKVLNLDEVIANSAKFVEVSAQILNVSDRLNAANAKIGTLETTMLTATQADLKYATIENLTAVTGRIETLETNALTAGSALIHSLTSDVANINTLMFGTASGGSLTTEFSNSIVSLIGDAQIKSAMIKDITADKITSGKLYTNLVEVVSQSGNLDISDNTIQIRDDVQTARVQIGKDAAGDYNIYIWDKNGKLMFDPLYGIQEDGIKSAVIRNDMISETANISAKKLDINSLFTEINGSTETIKSNRIYVDADNQTLDVAFKTMSTSVNSLTENVSTQGTQLTTVQGQISSKIWQQDITTAVTELKEDVDSSLTALEGTTTTLTNQYTSLNQSLTSLTATVNSNTTTINKKADGSTVTALQSSLTTLQADLTGYKTTVSESYTSKTEFDSLQIGGRNYLLKSNVEKTAESPNSYYTSIDYTSVIPEKMQVATETKQYTLTIWLTPKEGKNAFTSVVFGGVNGGDGWAVRSNLGNFTVEDIHGTDMKKYRITKNLAKGQYLQSFVKILFERTSKDNAGCTVHKIKLEKGNKATDWTPAPEDIDSSIAQVDGKFANYSTTTQMNSAIEQKSGSILQTVSGTYATQSSLGNYATTQSVTASLALKIDRTDNNQIVSMINASADVIRLTADRFILDSTYSKINQDGTVQFTGGNIGGFTIDGNGLFNVQNGVGCGMQKFGLGSAFWAGAGGVGNGGQNAEFKVWHDGSVFAQKLYVTGGSMNINNNFIVDINGNLVSKGAADFQCATVYSNDFHSRGSMYVANNLDVGSTIGCNTLQVKNNMYVSNIFYYWYDGAWVTLRDYISAIVNGG